MLWGLLLVLVTGALAAQVVVRRSGEVVLAEPVAVGPLLVRLPVGWRVTEGPDGPAARAMSKDEGSVLTLQVRIDEVDGESPQQYLQAEFEDMLVESPRALTLAGRDGLMVSAAGVSTVTRRPMAVTVAAARLNERQMIRIELRRSGEWDGSDAVMVRQIARAVVVNKDSLPASAPNRRGAGGVGPGE